MELPEEFRDRMKALLGEEEYKQYEDSFSAERMYGLRVNTRKISVQEFEQISPFSLEKIPWIPNGFYYDGAKDSPAKHPYYHAGLYYLQEPSAMTPASLLPVEPGDAVLDLCAAPGGKATQLGVRLLDQGVLVANDISASRAKGLLKNLELFGIPNLIVANESADKLLASFSGFFDKILIDAPCSGEGMFRKDPAIIKSWIKKGPKEFAAIQQGIVSAAVKALKPGGMLLYSTCTFSPEENEGTILGLLQSQPELEVVEAPGYEGFSPGRPDWLSCSCGGYEEALRKCIRIWPHKMNAEGHFIALLQKKGTSAGSSKAITRKRKPVDNEEFRQFLTLLDRDWEDERFEMVQQRVYYLPAGADRTANIRLVRSGLLMGECRKNRFEPSQALAMSLKKEQCRQVLSLAADDVRVVKYLKGETIEAGDLAGDSACGWHLVCVEQYPLGWGKLIQGTLKNKYHAGWRWM